MNEMYYCFTCHEAYGPEELHQERELMDPSVPGSYQTWVGCPDCKDDPYEVTVTLLGEIFEEIQERANQLDDKLLLELLGDFDTLHEVIYE